MLTAIKYVSDNRMEKEANILACKVGDIYMACLMLYKNIPQTEENIIACKRIVGNKKKKEKAWFDWFINEGYKEIQ